MELLANNFSNEPAVPNLFSGKQILGRGGAGRGLGVGGKKILAGKCFFLKNYFYFNVVSNYIKLIVKLKLIMVKN
jgi:hypothetical protein